MSQQPDVRLESRPPDRWFDHFASDALRHELWAGERRLIVLGTTARHQDGTWHYAFGSGTSINQGGYARRDEALARLVRYVLIHLETNVRRAEQRREAVREALAAAG